MPWIHFPTLTSHISLTYPHPFHPHIHIPHNPQSLALQIAPEEKYLDDGTAVFDAEVHRLPRFSISQITTSSIEEAKFFECWSKEVGTSHKRRGLPP